MTKSFCKQKPRVRIYYVNDVVTIDTSSVGWHTAAANFIIQDGGQNELAIDTTTNAIFIFEGSVWQVHVNMNKTCLNLLFQSLWDDVYIDIYQNGVDFGMKKARPIGEC